MNRLVSFPAIAAVALALGACAQVQTATNWLASPTTKSAFQTLEVGSTSFVCAVAGTSAFAGQIEEAVKAKQALQTANGLVVTASQDACTALSGLVTGTAVITKVTTTAAGAVATIAPTK